MPRLRARTFYGLIVAGVALGVGAAGGGAWAYVQREDARPEGRRVLADVASQVVVPIAAMMGGTFGGLAGVATAILFDHRMAKRGG
ncbi:MAG TPA: hypothetical protein VH092_00015 [Urbifossiella sp.]|jgi:hypothetical protein|nr:hypothetical protein [Urbifossiella sp.]